MAMVGDMPEGYVAIALSADQDAAPVRLCAMVRLDPEPMAGQLVVLREGVDARVLLGCLVDAGGKVHRWVEIWVQNLDAVVGTPPAAREALTNAIIDQRWQDRFDAMNRLDSTAIIRTGWETSLPLPTFLDLSIRQPAHPVHADTGSAYMLCRDDNLLVQKELPQYSRSLYRYLYAPDLGDESPLVCVTEDTPANSWTISLDQANSGRRDLVPLNPGGGLMFVREYNPVGYESFVDLVGGGKWEGVLHGRSLIDLNAIASALKSDVSDLPSEGWVFMGSHGKWGRLVETFHLKLRLVADAVAAVRVMTRQQKLPFLNITADTFGVRLGEPGRGLPFLWTARAVLADPGDAIALSVEAGEARYFLPGASTAASVYRPENIPAAVSGHGTVRVRQILDDAGGGTIVEGTLVTQERVSPNPNDLIWIRLGLASRRVDLYAHPAAETALAAGELRFRTISMKVTDADQKALRESEGVPQTDVFFQVVPLLSTPCDLYALGVLAVRTLLVNQDRALPMALDEVLSLVRQLAVEHDPDKPLPQRIEAVFEHDSRWFELLGPHRLTREEMTVEDALDLVPLELWWKTLAMMVRMFPGMGPDSTCRDFGDAPAGGMHRVFDQVADELDALLVQTRSLIVIDWSFNREIHAVVRQHMVGMLERSV